MAHKHSVYDTDPHFSIDPKTRVITNLSGDSWTLMQYDHNSERITFELPRFIDKHDMTLCNLVQVHYINIGENGERNADIYEMTDLDLSPDSDDVAICSWLISRNATSFVGALSFSIRFACVTDGEVVYSWNTAVYNNIAIGTTINNANAIVEEYSDILAQWSEAIDNIPPDRVFIAEYGVTKYEEIAEAYSSGKAIFCRGNIEGLEGVIPMATIDKKYDRVCFSATQRDDMVTVAIEGGEWAYRFDEIGRTFTASYGKTTYDELIRADMDNKLICVHRQEEPSGGLGSYYWLYHRDYFNNCMEFRQAGADSTGYCRCTRKDGWSYGEYENTATPTKHADTHSKDGTDPITPESINALPGYIEDITSGDLDDYTAPGNYRIIKSTNTSIANTPFTGDTGTFLQVLPFNDSNTRLVQEAITNKIGGVDRKWRTKSVGDEGWSQWQDSCEVYIVKYDESINGDYEKVKKAWGLLTWKFGRSDDGKLLGNKTVFCKYRIYDAEKDQYEYHILPLSKITPNYISFRGMASDTTMRVTYLRNPDSFDSSKWGWRGWTDDKQTMLTTTSSTVTKMKEQIADLEKRIAALEQ